MLILTCVLLACVDAETICEHYCVEPLESLNGNPEHELAEAIKVAEAKAADAKAK